MMIFSNWKTVCLELQDIRCSWIISHGLSLSFITWYVDSKLFKFEHSWIWNLNLTSTTVKYCREPITWIRSFNSFCLLRPISNPRAESKLEGVFLKWCKVREVHSCSCDVVFLQLCSPIKEVIVIASRWTISTYAGCLWPVDLDTLWCDMTSSNTRDTYIRSWNQIKHK